LLPRYLHLFMNENLTQPRLTLKRSVV